MSGDPKSDPSRVDEELAAAFSELLQAFERSGAPAEIVDLARRLDDAICQVNRGSDRARPKG